MKNCTSIEQSKKLAEILPLESADMCYGINDDTLKYNDLPWLIPYHKYTAKEFYTPCWSLAALLELLPSYLGEYKDGIDFGLSKSVNGKWYSAHYLKTSDDGDVSAVYVETGDTSIDACYKMVIKLHEEGLL